MNCCKDCIYYKYYHADAGYLDFSECRYNSIFPDYVRGGMRRIPGPACEVIREEVGEECPYFEEKKSFKEKLKELIHV